MLSVWGARAPSLGYFLDTHRGNQKRVLPKLGSLAWSNAVWMMLAHKRHNDAAHAAWLGVRGGARGASSPPAPTPSAAFQPVLRTPDVQHGMQHTVVAAARPRWPHMQPGGAARSS